MTDEIRDESWRDGPPPGALEFMVFRHDYTTFDEFVLVPVRIPNHITLENISQWLKERRGLEYGMKFTVMSVGTKDVFEIGREHCERTVTNIESTVYE